MYKILESIFIDPNFQLWLLDIIRINQMMEEGVGEENIIIGTYSPATESINPDKRAGTHFTLHDTGEFFSTFKIFANKDHAIIDADGDKDTAAGIINIFELYGQEQNLLGLTEKNWELMIEKLKPLIIEQVWKSIAV